MNTSRIPLLNTFYDNLTSQQTLAIVNDAIVNKRQIHHTVINANKVVLLQKNLELRNSVNSADIINIDGKGVLWAAEFLGKPVKERVTGIDFMMEVLQLAHKNSYKVYLLGAAEETLQALVDKLSNEFSDHLIAGHRNGYFTDDNEKEIVSQIAASEAQILFVAMPSPKKENFLFKYKKELEKINFIMGVGGSFDVLAGKVSRAPLWMQRIGMEWFYRLIQEPKKMWKRYLIGNFSFLTLVLKSKISLSK